MSNEQKPRRFPRLPFLKGSEAGEESIPPEPELPKPVRKITLPWRQILVIGGVGLLILTMLSLNSRLSEAARLKGERDKLATQIAGMYITKMVLQTQVAEIGSDAEVIEAARAAHMIRDGEKLIIVLTPPNNQILEEPTPEAQQVKKETRPWEVWYALFFGK